MQQLPRHLAMNVMKMVYEQPFLKGSSDGGQTESEKRAVLQWTSATCNDELVPSGWNNANGTDGGPKYASGCSGNASSFTCA